ncbi:hypothetical protein [Listeria monocytogenes]|uniref:hypothetical protein n=1 Tax=Listeria monocytogenes TaxID=1639 RepID=UPI0022FFF7B7|nr:DUF1642 domain-containing protein [Listeria monocytogenes]
MKFKKGDLVEVIWRSELYRGTVTRVVEATNEIEVKLAKKPLIDYLFKQSQVSKVKLVKVPQFVADWIEKKKEYIECPKCKGTGYLTEGEDKE